MLTPCGVKIILNSNCLAKSLIIKRLIKLAIKAPRPCK